MVFSEFVEQYQTISENYDGKSIFVTGSTGFLGKVFVEKILYRCPKIANVYVLIRETPKASAEEKIKKLLTCPIFKRIKDERPQDLNKIIPIVGDISKPNLGINKADENVLVDNVSMVFHFAATIKFNEPLKVAINVNFEGTRRVLDLCLKLKNIQVFLYVSTAFSNYKRQVIDEVLYPPPVPLSYVDTLMKQDDFTEEQTKTILNGLPNTYTFTKALAENLVAKFHEQEGIPTVIVRPSIVISCEDEPMNGWIDNWFGATALVASVGKGVVRALYADSNNTIDFIPADYVANVVIAAAAKSKRSKNLQVYNSCSSAANPITLQQLNTITINDVIKKHKMNDLPLPGLIFIKSKLFMTIIIFLLEIIPAYIVDFVMLLRGKKQMCVNIQARATEVRKALEPFTSRSWNMRSANTSALSDSLSFHDRSCFPCDAAVIHWDRVIPIYCHGIWKYLIGN